MIVVHTVTTIVTAHAVPMTVRFVAQGDRYGLRDCLTHDDPRPMVEFYDARFPHSEGRGQFISRYYLFTLLAHPAGNGLMLEGSQPTWNVDPAALQHALRWAQYVMLAQAQQAIEDAFEGAA